MLTLVLPGGLLLSLEHLPGFWGSHTFSGLAGVVQVRASLQALAPPSSSPALPVCSLGFILLQLPLQVTQVTSEHTTVLRLADFWEDHRLQGCQGNTHRSRNTGSDALSPAGHGPHVI